MGCLEKPVCNKYTGQALKELTFKLPREEIYHRVRQRLDGVAKPLDGLGSFESLIARIGAIQRTEEIDISKKAVIIFCSDNGIVEEGISQSGQEVTLAVAKSMAEGKSSVGKMAAVIGADTVPVDIGVNYHGKIDGVLDRKIAFGTKNFRKEPAMTQEETIRAIFTGIELVKEYSHKGYRILAAGEMGIGNTTTSSAVAAALLGCNPAEVTGRGAGLGDAGLLHKQEIISEAIERYSLKGAAALRILQTVGGFDLAGIAGVCIGGALYHVPIVLDGVISLAAALAAERILPGTAAYLLPSHKGKEPAAARLAEALGIEPVIDAHMALGEGTGAVMMLSLLDIALSVYSSRTTFADISVEQYKHL